MSTKRVEDFDQEVAAKIEAMKRVLEALNHDPEFYKYLLNPDNVRIWVDQDGYEHFIPTESGELPADIGTELNAFYNSFYGCGEQCHNLSNIYRRVKDRFGLDANEIAGLLYTVNYTCIYWRQMVIGQFAWLSTMV